MMSIPIPKEGEEQDRIVLNWSSLLQTGLPGWPALVYTPRGFLKTWACVSRANTNTNKKNTDQYGTGCPSGKHVGCRSCRCLCKFSHWRQRRQIETRDHKQCKFCTFHMKSPGYPWHCIDHQGQWWMSLQSYIAPPPHFQPSDSGCNLLGQAKVREFVKWKQEYQ